MARRKTIYELRAEAKKKLELAKELEQQHYAALGKKLCKLAQGAGKTAEELLESLG